MPGTDAWQFLGRALGANPTPMSFAEVYTVLILNFIVASDNIASMMASVLVDLKISPLAFLLSVNLLILVPDLVLFLPRMLGYQG